MRKSNEMELNKEYWSRNWNDSSARYYTKINDNEIKSGVVHRYSKSQPEKIWTCVEWDKYFSKNIKEASDLVVAV